MEKKTYLKPRIKTMRIDTDTMMQQSLSVPIDKDRPTDDSNSGGYAKEQSWPSASGQWDEWDAE